MKIKTIKWVERQYSTAGFIGKVHLFSFGWNGSMNRDDPEKAKKQYFLSSTLPGFNERIYFQTQDECKIKATELIGEFIAKIIEE